jgi:hypothetical protein
MAATIAPTAADATGAAFICQSPPASQRDRGWTLSALQSSLCWILGNVSKQPTRAFAERGCGRCHTSPTLATGESRRSMGRGPVTRSPWAHRHRWRPTPSACDRSRGGKRPDQRPFRGGRPPRMVHTPAPRARSRAPLHPGVVSRDGTGDLPIATSLRASLQPPETITSAFITYCITYWARARLCGSKADEEFRVARPCRGRREAMVHRTPLRSAHWYGRCGPEKP